MRVATVPDFHRQPPGNRATMCLEASDQAAGVLSGRADPRPRGGVSRPKFSVLPA